MKLFNIIIVISILLCFALIKAQPPIGCNRLDGNYLDTAFQRLSVFGSIDRKYPSNNNEMQTFCNEQLQLQKWVKEYANKCLNKLSRQVISLFMYTNGKVYSDTCKSNRLKREFLRVSACGNAAKNDTVKCFDALGLAADGITHHNDDKLKIPLLCCNYNIIKSCHLKAYGKYPQQCKQSLIDGLERIMDKQIFDVMNFLCGEYSEDSDKCDKIIGLMPKSNLKVAPKSPIKPIIKVLTSIAE